MTQNIRDVTGRNRSVQDMLRDIERAGLSSGVRSPDNGGNGGGGGDVLEQRVKHLEEGMSEVKADVKNIRERLARMEGEISRLPGYPGMFVICGTLVGVVGLIVRFF